MMQRPLIFVAGSVAQRPSYGGHAWVFLHLVRGLQRLGWRVVFVDRLEPDMLVDRFGRSVGPLDHVKRFVSVMDAFSVEEYSLLDGDRGVHAGLDRPTLQALARESACLINVMGFLTDDEIFAFHEVRVFFDIDPGFPQMWRELDYHDAFRGHNRFVTIGERIGSEDCGVPTCGLTWIPSPQPIVLDDWPVTANGSGVFTSVVSWRGPYAPVKYRGRSYGLRVHEFRRFLELPGRTGASFQLALDIDPSETRDLEALRSHGWDLTDPVAVAGDPARYRDYIRRSKAEFMVAKNMYVQTRSGWISDRSLCYLASGRPVLAQDTGFSESYPVGRGLIPFSSVEEAVAGVEAITCDYGGHARAAREIAEEYFDARKVLPRLLGNLGVG